MSFYKNIIVIFLIQSIALVAHSEPERKIDLNVDSSGIKNIDINIPVGKISISSAPGDKITAQAIISCTQFDNNKCNNNIFKDIFWTSMRNEKSVRVALTPPEPSKYNNISMLIKITLPEDKLINVELGYGDLDIQEGNACLDVNLNAGNVQLNFHEKFVKSVYLTAKAGDTSLTTTKGTMHGERSNFIGAVTKWSGGNGTCQLNAKVNAGNIQLILK